MGGKSQPDMTQAAVAQGEANREVVRDQTFANRPDQYTPWGSTEWNPYQTIDPATGQPVTSWQQTSALTPELQDILNKQVAIQGGRSDIAGTLTQRMGDEFGTPMDWRGLNPMGQVPTSQFTLPEEIQRNVDYSDAPGISAPTQQTGLDTEGLQDFAGGDQQTSLDYSNIGEIGDPTQLRARGEQNIYDMGEGRLNDRFESQRQQLELKLRNQGLAPQDEAFKAQMQSLGTQENDARQQLRGQAIQEGRAEQGLLFDQDAQRRQIGTGEADRMGQFYNESQQGLYGMSSGQRAQQFGERQSQADLYNQGNQNMFGMQSGLRGQATGEQDSQAAYNRLAGVDAYNMALGSNNQNYNQAMQGSAYANQIRQQQITESMTKRGFSLNEINALLSGQQVGMPSMPNFSQAAAAEAAPLYQAAADQASLANAANPMNALIGAAGAAGGAFLGGQGFANLTS